MKLKKRQHIKKEVLLALSGRDYTFCSTVCVFHNEYSRTFGENELVKVSMRSSKISCGLRTDCTNVCESENDQRSIVVCNYLFNQNILHDTICDPLKYNDSYDYEISYGARIWSHV